MSNGGFMSYRLACELSERIAAIAPVAASLSLTECNPSRPVPIIHFHSYIDSSVLYYGGIGNGISNHYNTPNDSVMDLWSGNNNCLVQRDTISNTNEYTLTKWTSCECGVEIHRYVTQDGGHSWPGGNQTLIGDPASAYINATDLMWTFFQQYSSTSINKTTYDPVHFKVFPNPTSGIINIETINPSVTFSVRIQNAVGQEVLKDNNVNFIDISSLMSGLYIISLKTNDQLIQKKIIKK